MGTRGAWARDFLAALGNSSPDAATIRLVAAWTVAEGTNARYNPLATTWDNGDASNFNSVGVKNYKSRAAGIDATVKTVRGRWPGYAVIVDGLTRNNPSIALSGMLVSPWGTNFGKVREIYQSSRAIEDEPLAAESGGAVEQTETTPQTSETPTRTSNLPGTGAVTEDSVRNAITGLSGALLIIIGVWLLISGVMRSDTVSSAVAAVSPAAGAVIKATS